jgi:phage gp29-like protein
MGRYKKPQPPAGKRTTEDFTTKIILEFKDRQRADIQKWQRAVQMATNNQIQRPAMLQDLYDNLKADGHFISQVELRKAATLCNSFTIQDRNGKEQPDKTALFKKQWFYDYMEDVLDSIFYGYTLLELVDPGRLKFKAIPRRNVATRNREIRLSVNEDRGIDYLPFLGVNLIEAGSPEDVGLMANLCGQLIWKRNAQQSWAEFSEKFGLPLITATTTKTNDAEIARVRQMLSALGEAAQAVLPEGTNIDIKETNRGDAYQVFDKQIDRTNSEISKALVGGTMVSDNGASRSQSEVHERNLDDKIAERDRRIVTFTTNDQLIPILAANGHNVNPENDVFVFDESFNLTLTEHWEIVDSALNRFEIPSEWISKTFNIPILKEREQPQHNPFNGFAGNFR